MNTVGEPVGIGALVVAFINSVVALLGVVDVVHLDANQLAALNLVIVNAAVVVTAALVRRHVTPTVHLTGDTAPMKGAPRG